MGWVGELDALVNRLGDSGGLFNQFIATGVPQLVDSFAKLGETKMSATRGFRKVRAREERFAVGQAKHRHWPTAVTIHGLNSVHVDRINIWSFFAIDLDVDEQSIHEFAGGFVLKRLMGHDMAPMAGRVADGNEDGHISPFRLGQRFRPPRPPIDGIVSVLSEIRAGFIRKAICHGRESTGDEVLRCGHVADPSYRIQ